MMMIKNRSSLQLLHMFIILLLLLCTKSAPLAFESAVVEDANITTKCIERERQSLLIFKASLIDDNGRLASWGSEEDKKDCCKWSGVHCSNRTGHVIMLNLSAIHYSKLDDKYCSLRGKISPSLLELRHLKYLDLSYNDFGCTPIPKFIGSLAKLKHLDLSHASFGGIIPCQLGNLSKLYHLDLSFNGFNINVENIDWLSRLSSLAHLDMSRVDLSRATHWVSVITSLPFLSYLDLHGCKLSRVMYPTLSLTNSSASIAALYLSNNNFTSSLYHWLFNLSSSSSLVNLDLSENHIKGTLPHAFGSMTSLAHLSLRGNQLEGLIPNSFRNLCSLKTLDLSGNNLNGNLSSLLHGLPCAEASLESLILTSNTLTGSLNDITRFSSLRKLSLDKNRLSGFLPNTLGQLSKLKYLDVSFNSLHGVISEAHFLNLAKLKYLDLSVNTFVFKLSPQWVSPFQLDTVILAYCDLGPRFPKWLQTQSKISYLNLSNSGISDTIPMWFWNQSSRLQLLDLSSNKFRGMLPDLSSKFVNYPLIDLNSNYFVGPVPQLPSSLAILNLSGNKFSGRLSFLCSITNWTLTFLDLSDNLLSGGLPGCLERFQELILLNLAHNKLSGKIPSYASSLFHLETLVLRNNSFFGELHFTLRNCTLLKVIDLGGNKLSGNIPAWIGENLSKLYLLSLRSNKFNGSIPLQLCHLTKLGILDLSGNSLSGSIPRCFDNFTAMARQGLVLPLEYIHVNHEKVPSWMQRGSSFYIHNYFNTVLMVWKGTLEQYIRIPASLHVIDLSSNKLTGELPEEITNLEALRGLNLSLNELYGVIPPKIGHLRDLESLDLSRNKFSGEIPLSIARLNSLGVLNLSYNNLSERIPRGKQFDTFENSSYTGNSGLCGWPLSSECLMNDAIIGGNEFGRWFCMVIALGFSTGFWAHYSSTIIIPDMPISSF